MTKTIFVTGGSGVWDVFLAWVLADAGHTVYVGENHSDPGLSPVNAVTGNDTRVRTIPYESVDQQSITAAVQRVVAEAGTIDVLIHLTTPVTFGPAESFTPYQLGQVYDLAVLSAQRVLRAVLPLMRERQDGLLIWTGPGIEPGPASFSGPGRAVRAGQLQLVESYAVELAPFGIDVTFLTYEPGNFEGHGAPAPLKPDDTTIAQAYGNPLAAPLRKSAGDPPAPVARAMEVADSVVGIVEARSGARPVHLALWKPSQQQQQQQQQPTDQE
ncbi:SDR family NAD(P)-dependent oxidoreductase [Streptomyces sp. NPDC058394]|uniref:SDR family NAD(P)-dependent oxidoreductase n=1 Tax=Streptomyces sp. NPDC058394 TaxID=3346477 RepID=UPI0036570927